MEWGLRFREYFRGTLIDFVSMGHKVRLRRTHEARPNVPFGTGGDHKEHKEGERSYLFIKYQLT